MPTIRYRLFNINASVKTKAFVINKYMSPFIAENELCGLPISITRLQSVNTTIMMTLGSLNNLLTTRNEMFLKYKIQKHTNTMAPNIIEIVTRIEFNVVQPTI